MNSEKPYLPRDKSRRDEATPEREAEVWIPGVGTLTEDVIADMYRTLYGAGSYTGLVSSNREVREALWGFRRGESEVPGMEQRMMDLEVRLLAYDKLLLRADTISRVIVTLLGLISIGELIALTKLFMPGLFE